MIVPEIEAIATDTLIDLESEGFTVIPSAKAARLTMDREGIRRLAAEQLGLATSPFKFAVTHDEFLSAVETIGMPCVVKPVMSSSGKVRVPSSLQRILNLLGFMLRRAAAQAREK